MDCPNCGTECEVASASTQVDHVFCPECFPNYEERIQSTFRNNAAPLVFMIVGAPAAWLYMTVIHPVLKAIGN